MNKGSVFAFIYCCALFLVILETKAQVEKVGERSDYRDTVSRSESTEASSSSTNSDIDNPKGVVPWPVSTCGWYNSTAECFLLNSKCVYQIYKRPCDCDCSGADSKGECTSYDPSSPGKGCWTDYLACPGWVPQSEKGPGLTAPPMEDCPDTAAGITVKRCGGTCAPTRNLECSMNFWTVNCTYDSNLEVCNYPIHQAAPGEAPCSCQCSRTNQCLSRHYAGEVCGAIASCPGWDPGVDGPDECAAIQVKKVPLCIGTCPVTVPPPSPSSEGGSSLGSFEYSSPELFSSQPELDSATESGFPTSTP